MTTLALSHVVALPRQHQWVLDARLLVLPEAAAPPGLSCRGSPPAQQAQQPVLCMGLAVGFTDNSVDLHAFVVPSHMSEAPVSTGNSEGEAPVVSTNAPLMRVRSSIL